MTRSSRLASALSCALLACSSELQGSSPHPTEVIPGAGYQLRETEIRIRGDGFLVELYQQADGTPAIDSTFRAWLDATELTNVSWVSENELRAQVPSGLPTGDHRLVVRDPRGATGALDAAFTVVPGAPAALVAALAAAPVVVNEGQAITVILDVANGGEAAALDLQPSLASAGASPASGPTPASLARMAGGATQRFQWTYVAGAAPGPAVFDAAAVGTDENSGTQLSTSAAEQVVAVQHRAALAAGFRSSRAAPMAAFVVELEARNPVADPAVGQAAASGVAPGPLVVAAEAGFLDPSQVSCAPRSVGPASVDAGGLAVFSWTCAAAAVGQVKVSASLAGSDANDGLPLEASAVGVVLLDEVAKIIDDPFGDGTSFSFVFAYDGHVFLGPSGDGRGLVRCLPDGTGCASWALSLYRDEVATGSVHQNPCPQYVTLGSTTPPGSPGFCDPDNPSSTACNCGPNLESGRGVFTSMVIGGNEWLVAMGRSKKRFLRYLYMTRETASPLHVSYVDLTVSIPVSPDPAVEDVTSLAVLNDRVYAGLQVDTADGPRMVVLTRTPVAPGLDAGASDTVATTFQGTAMNESGAGISQVDAMLGFEGRLVVANRRAVLLSRTGTPDLSAADASTQFDDCTPLAPATWLAGAFDYAGKIDVTPADKVVCALAAWQGRLYLARNTLANVPEIWVFTPRHDTAGGFLGCAADRSDWQRIATNFADPANVRATALFASSAFLYVGYDNAASGLQVFRTSSPAPLDEAAFTGRLGCTAPCTPLGRAGFGDPTNVRVFDARTMTFAGVDEVWATVGSASGPVRVYRVSE
jgi:hypothetical protein